MVDTAGDDLLWDDLLDGIELLSPRVDHGEFASFLEFLDPESSAADPAFSGASCVANEGDLQCLHNAPPVPQQPTHEYQYTTAPSYEDPEAVRLERIRAKNRRGQAKYREKLKREKAQVEARIRQTKATLSDTCIRCRALREERAAAVSRGNAAVAELHRLTVCTPLAPPHSAPPCIAQALPDPQLPNAHAQPSIACRPRRRRPADVVPAFGFGAGIYSSIHEPERDIASYRCCAPITLNGVLEHVPACSDLLHSRDLPQHMPQAVREFQAATSASLSVPRDDICWFMQFPHLPCAGSQLSHSASLASDKCRLSLMAFGEALSLEAGFLLEMHRVLVVDAAAPAHRVAASYAVEASDEDELSAGGLSAEPTRPSADAYSREAFRCGVNEACTLSDVIAGVFVSLIRRYRRGLRRITWRAVCRKALRKALSSLASMQPVPQPHDPADAAVRGGSSSSASPSDGQAGAPAAESDCDPGGAVDSSDTCCADSPDPVGGCFDDERRDVCELLAALAHCIWSELQADARSGSGADGVAEPWSRQQIEARMLEVNAHPAVTCVTLFQQAPLKVRQLCQDSNTCAVELAEMEGHQRRLLRALALQPEQRAHCAQIWRQWYKKRRLLDREFDDAVDSIADAFPSTADLPADFARLLERLCQATGQLMRPTEVKATDASTSGASGQQSILLASKLVGVSGATTQRSATLLQALKAVHATDGLLYEHFLFLTVMPSWYLTQVQHTQLHASLLDEGITLIDNLRLCQAAAQEERWKEVFTSLSF